MHLLPRHGRIGRTLHASGAARTSVLRRARSLGLTGSVLGMLAATAPLAVGGAATSPAAHARAPVHAAPAPSTAPSAPSPPRPAGLYRIVGCRSQGAGAYTGGPARREVAIGFDDGPAADTPSFLSMLEREHTRATFFMIGEQVTPTFGATLMRELRDGDALGDHTFTHPNLDTSGDVRGQLQRTLAVIRALSGYTPCVFRPPYGDYDASVVRTARSLGLATVLWNVDPADWARPGTGAIVSRVLAQVRPGSIIISHDGGGPRGETLAAYPAIISALHSRGYRIVTIPELLGFRAVYVPCIRLCDGIGVTRRQLPPGAIVEHAP